MYSSGGLLLLSAAGGYWVLERASSHKGKLKQVGQLLGAVIIVASLLGVVCRVWYAATCLPGAKGGLCPFTPKSSSMSPRSP